MQQRMFDDRIEKLRAIVQSVSSIAQSLETRVVAHEFTREQALARLGDGDHAVHGRGGGLVQFMLVWLGASAPGPLAPIR